VIRLPGGRIFGEVTGYPVGATFPSRTELAKSGAHRPTQAGICGSAKDGGAESIVVSGGYEDDEDHGNLIVYTGHGGRDPSTGRQVRDQELTDQNLALAHNVDTGLPVRVVRGAHATSKHAPETALRYDGLFRVEAYWAKSGTSGYRVYHYRLVAMMEEEADTFRPPSLAGGTEAPKRRQHSTTRLVRDTAVSRDVKALHKHRCQVCGLLLDTPTGPYAEAAHIRPLGTPHDGPDTSDNVLCLCPNHHVLFDRGAFSIADDLSLLGMGGATPRAQIALATTGSRPRETRPKPHPRSRVAGYQRRASDTTHSVGTTPYPSRTASSIRAISSAAKKSKWLSRFRCETLPLF
jgi:putative restriction endonuclease